MLGFRFQILTHAIKQYPIKILRKIPLFFSLTLIFNPAPTNELVTMATKNDLSSIF